MSRQHSQPIAKFRKFACLSLGNFPTNIDLLALTFYHSFFYVKPSMSVSDLIVEIDKGHLFRYPSEIDPRKKKAKGGYLTGKIVLPQEYVGVDMKMILTTVPEEDLAYTDDMIKQDPTVREFHPSIIHICRRKGRGRMYDREVVPNWRMFKQEFKICDRKVYICNKTSDLDEGRDIPTEDFLMNLGEDNIVHLGEEADKLNVLILKCVTDARSKDSDDITLKKMMSSRIESPDLHTKLKGFFTHTSAANKTRMRLKVELLCPDTGILVGSGISDSIVNTDSKINGALKFYDVIPNKSCSSGGEKIVMISQFAMDKNVKPRFQLWTPGGQRVPLEEEESLLVQPSELEIVRDNIVFIAPGQPELETIQSRAYTFKLVGLREKDNYESSPLNFCYVQHNNLVVEEIHLDQNDQNLVHIVQKCVFCEYDPSNTKVKNKSLVPKLEGAKPRQKRKTLTGENLGKKRRVSSNSSHCSVLSPDSGTETMELSGSPPGLASLFDEKTVEDLSSLHDGQEPITIDFDFEDERKKMLMSIETDGESKVRNKKRSSTGEAKQVTSSLGGFQLVGLMLCLVIGILLMIQGVDINMLFSSPAVITGCCFVILPCIMYFYNKSYEE